jgi:C4-dicarboxylate-specific signal transduction histidine kinase
LSSFESPIPLSLLQRDRRRVQILDVREQIDEVLAIFGSFLADAAVDVRTNTTDATALPVTASPAALQAIFANLITNALTSFSARNAPARQRILEFSVSSVDSSVVVRVGDSGRGIVDIPLNDIWLPGITSTQGGTGLGLTIVRDTVVDLGGSIAAVEHGPLGGAEFILHLPRA